jgi:hypothetical protein
MAEQTFVWAAKFKKIMSAMPKGDRFFYHCMVGRRNKYISQCYKENRDPTLPKIHGGVQET